MNRSRPTLSRTVRLAALAGLLLAAGSASAQYDFPRIGLSAAPDRYVDAMEAEIGEEFTMYACVFAHAPGEPLQQPLQSVAWVIHQACCGAYLDLVDVVYNPEFVHVGQSPLSGVVSSAETCVDREGIWLATLTVRLDAPGPGDYLWAAGPYAGAADCDGGTPVFMDMPVNITVPGSTPVVSSSWGTLKARYR
jgi:hypothetical protein